jgi:uroporphyrinogen III methyltransferase/synthase
VKDQPVLSAGTAVASIGPITSETVRGLGLPVTIEATGSTIPGLLRAVEKHFRDR